MPRGHKVGMPLSAAHKQAISKTLKGRPNPRPEHRAELAAAKRKQRTAWIQGYKLMLGCIDCGYRNSAEALDFDHRPGEIKLFGLCKATKGNPIADIWAEIQKCDVVCANCHRIRTGARRASTVS